MCYKYKNRTIWIVLISLIVIGIWLSAPVCFADNEDGFTEDASIPKIKDIPGDKSPLVTSFIDEVENHYDFVGTVDEVQPEGVVIGDSYFKKASNGVLLGTGKGKRIGIILNKAGEIVSCEPVIKISK